MVLAITPDLNVALPGFTTTPLTITIYLIGTLTSPAAIITQDSDCPPRRARRIPPGRPARVRSRGARTTVNDQHVVSPSHASPAFRSRRPREGGDRVT